MKKLLSKVDLNCWKQALTRYQSCLTLIYTIIFNEYLQQPFLIQPYKNIVKMQDRKRTYIGTKIIIINCRSEFLIGVKFKKSCISMKYLKWLFSYAQLKKKWYKIAVKLLCMCLCEGLLSELKTNCKKGWYKKRFNGKRVIILYLVVNLFLPS